MKLTKRECQETRGISPCQTKKMVNAFQELVLVLFIQKTENRIPLLTLLFLPFLIPSHYISTHSFVLLLQHMVWARNSAIGHLHCQGASLLSGFIRFHSANVYLCKTEQVQLGYLHVFFGLSIVLMVNMHTDCRRSVFISQL